MSPELLNQIVMVAIAVLAAVLAYALLDEVLRRREARSREAAEALVRDRHRTEALPSGATGARPPPRVTTSGETALPGHGSPHDPSPVRSASPANWVGRKETGVTRTAHVAAKDHRTRRGEFGEAVVRSIVDVAGHRAFHDVTIPSSNGNGTQIDHVVVVGRSVVCIETKCWAGHVTTHQTSPTWHRVIGSKEEELDNPLLQNRYHAEQMHAQLGGRRDGFVGDVRQFVVMTGEVSPSIGNHNRILTADMLDGALRTVGSLGSPRETEMVWSKVVGVATANAWTIGVHGTHPDNARLTASWGGPEDEPDHDVPTLH